MMRGRAKIPHEEAIANEPAPKSTRRWREGIAKIKDAQWLPDSHVPRGVRSPHFWIIAALMAVLAFVYYADRIFVNGDNFFTTVHDLHRVLLLIPVLYAAVLFRVWGALIASFVFLGILLPRALLVSPYPDPLFRAIAFFGIAALVSLLIAVQLNRLEAERKAKLELEAANQELTLYVQRLSESQEQLIHAEKLTSLGQMAAAIAHEINNPLAGVLVYTKLLSKKLGVETFSREEAATYLKKMEGEISRSSQIIRGLLDFARQSEPSFGAVDMKQVIDQVLTIVGHQAEMQKIEMLREISPSLPRVMADFDQMQQVFTNLILNAIQAMPDGGKITLRGLEVNDRVRLDVQDTGCGISKENLNKLFAPFFTTKGKGKGVGLGLAVAHGIMERHKGRIEVQSEVGKGTIFSVYLEVYHEEKG
jgi:signal transduction histidine kinase